MNDAVHPAARSTGRRRPAASGRGHPPAGPRAAASPRRQRAGRRGQSEPRRRRPPRPGHADPLARHRRGGVPARRAATIPSCASSRSPSRGKAPQVPGPLLRAPVGTTVRLTLRNRSDSALMLSGFRPSLQASDDTLQIAAGATREITFRLDAVGQLLLLGRAQGTDQIRAARLARLAAHRRVRRRSRRARRRRQERDLARHRVVPRVSRPRRSRARWCSTARRGRTTSASRSRRATRFTGRSCNAAAVEHPLHLHGFYFRVDAAGRRARRHRDRAVAAAAAEHADASHRRHDVALVRADDAGQLGVPLPLRVARRRDRDAARLARCAHACSWPASRAGRSRHACMADTTMRGLVIGMHVTPAPGYKEPVVAERRTITAARAEAA